MWVFRWSLVVVIPHHTPSLPAHSNSGNYEETWALSPPHWLLNYWKSFYPMVKLLVIYSYGKINLLMCLQPHPTTLRGWANGSRRGRIIQLEAKLGYEIWDTHPLGGSVIGGALPPPKCTSYPSTPSPSLLLSLLPTVLFRTLVICSENASGTTNTEIKNSSCPSGSFLSSREADNRHAFIM